MPGCGGMVRGRSRRLVAYSSVFAEEWFTEFVPVIGMDKIMAALRAKAATNDHFQAQVIVQFAAVRTDSPDSPATLGSVQTASSGSIEYPTGAIDISASAATKFYVRFGVAYRYNPTGGSQSSADVSLDINYEQCGEIAGGLNAQLFTSTSDMQVVALTGLLSPLMVEKIKAALMVTSKTGNFQWKLTYRTFSTNREVPGAWSDSFEQSYRTATGDVNTGELTVSGLGSAMWIQIGLAYTSSSGNGQASVSLALGTRRS